MGMSWDKVRFRIREVGNVGDNCIVVLHEVGGERVFPISLSHRATMDVFSLMNPSDDNPVCGFSIIDSLTSAFGIIAEEVVITRVERGRYMGKAIFNECGQTETIPVGIDEALMLSLSLRCPLFIDGKLLAQQTISGNVGGLSIPLNVMPVSILQEMLDAAIQEEEYSLAQILSNEIRQRER